MIVASGSAPISATLSPASSISSSLVSASSLVTALGTRRTAKNWVDFARERA